MQKKIWTERSNGQIKKNCNTHPRTKSKTTCNTNDLQHQITMLKVFTELDFKSFLETKVALMATNQEGSLILQQSIPKMNDECISLIFEEIHLSFHTLLSHMFANYFCQKLYVRLRDSDRHRAIIGMFQKLDSLLKGPISFKSVICLLEISISEQTQIYVSSYLMSIEANKFLRHTKYMKVIETLITIISEERLGFLINLVCNNIMHFIRTKQGYYLIRKLIKFVKNVDNQMIIVESILSQLHAVMATGNGALIANCIVKYFTQQIPEIRAFHSKNSQLSFSKQIFNEAVSLQRQSFKSRFVNKPDNSALKRFIKVYFLDYLCGRSSSELQKFCQVYHKKLIQLILTQNLLAEAINSIFKEAISTLKMEALVIKIAHLCNGAIVFKPLFKQFIIDGYSLSDLLRLNLNCAPSQLQTEWANLIIEVASKKPNPLSEDDQLSNFNEKLFLKLKSRSECSESEGSDSEEDEIQDTEFEKFAENNKSFFLPCPELNRVGGKKMKIKEKPGSSKIELNQKYNGLMNYYQVSSNNYMCLPSTCFYMNSSNCPVTWMQSQYCFNNVVYWNNQIY